MACRPINIGRRADVILEKLFNTFKVPLRSSAQASFQSHIITGSIQALLSNDPFPVAGDSIKRDEQVLVPRASFPPRKRSLSNEHHVAACV